MTRQLLAFSRQQVLAPKVVDLTVLVDGLNKMLRRLIGEDIELVTMLSATGKCVLADAGQLSQVLMNLALNSRDAMPHGGKLSIEVSAVEVSEDQPLKPGSNLAGSFVRLSIADTGSGMSQDTMTHMFEPFFTTKGPGKGTGLGLATAIGVMDQSGGTILVDSELGSGTTFHLHLPTVELGDGHSGTPLVEAVPIQASGTVLLVEDDAAVRMLTRQLLKSAGYTVLEASGAEEAVTAALGHPGPIHLLLTDVVMPHVSGTEVARRVTALRPNIPVIFMSGHNDDAVLRQGLLSETVNFLQKPFTLEVLTHKVRDALLGVSKTAA